MPYQTNEHVSQSIQRSNFGTLGRIARRKLANDNDIKIIIQGKNSATGIGKTTLAIQLCRFIDEQWSAEQKAFIDIREYINAHKSLPSGSALLLDEIEAGADRRRANSHENVELSQAWATLRAQNIATVCTLPTISMLDSRMLELADFWILVKRRGLAQPYQINVNDFAPWKNPQRNPLPGDEHIQFHDLPDDDPDKAYLDEIKDDLNFSEEKDFVPEDEHVEALEKAREEAAREKRNQIIRDLYDTLDVSYSDLEQVDAFPNTRSTISEIINE